jgi:peptide-methionine (R)-S-oxide reductase
MQLSDKDWQTKLTKEQYEVLRKKGTEQAFTGELLHNKLNGTYRCIGCGIELFGSEHKFDSGSGWPSFYDVKNAETVKLIEDNIHGMHRTEVLCANCGGHLGHVFNDAVDQPTNQRFCINSCALNFEPETKK